MPFSKVTNAIQSVSLNSAGTGVGTWYDSGTPNARDALRRGTHPRFTVVDSRCFE